MNSLKHSHSPSRYQHSHLFPEMQVLLNVIFDLFIRVFLLIINHLWSFRFAHTQWRPVQAHLTSR